jgi:hypothetical protein
MQVLSPASPNQVTIYTDTDFKIRPFSIAVLQVFTPEKASDLVIMLQNN